MAKPTKRTDPELWETVKADVTEGDRGGEPGQWSARKAQLAVTEYKHEGGGYVGERDPHNSLKQWGDEDWGTKSGEASSDTHERYLPKAAREHFSPQEYARTTAKKRADTRKGEQFSDQPGDIARKTAAYRHGGDPSRTTKAELYEMAKRRKIEGRSRMSKAELAAAVGA